MLPRVRRGVDVGPVGIGMRGSINVAIFIAASFRRSASACEACWINSMTAPRTSGQVHGRAELSTGDVRAQEPQHPAA
jgi:hypothetical protein